jgi:predicted RNase H-like HicB family nuclease
MKDERVAECARSQRTISVRCPAPLPSPLPEWRLLPKKPALLAGRGGTWSWLQRGSAPRRQAPEHVADFLWLNRGSAGDSHGVLFDMSSRYHVDAVWDTEAGVWVATSDDVPGLATEAPTLDEVAEKLRRMIPELLHANGVLEDGRGKSR